MLTRRLLPVVLLAATAAAPLATRLQAQTDPSPDNIEIRAGEISLEGTVQSVSAAHRAFAMRVVAFTNPGERRKTFPKPKYKTVEVGKKAYVRDRFDETRQYSFADIKRGVKVTVVGRDAGEGSVMNAREVALSGTGKATPGNPPGRLETRTPTRTLHVPARGLAFLPDSKRLAILDTAGTIRLWSVTSQATTGVIHEGVRGSARGSRSFLLMSPDGKWLAADARGSEEGGTAPGLVTLYNTRTWLEAVTLKGHQGAVTTAAFSRDARRMATGSADGTARIWDVSGGQERQALQVGGSVTSVAFSHDATLLAVGTGESASVWDTATGQRVQVMESGGPGVAFSPDGGMLATGSRDGSVLMWDTSTWKVARALAGHRRPASQLRFSPDGKLLATVAPDQAAVFLWDLATGKTKQIMQGQVPLEFSPDGRMLATSVGGVVRVWGLR